MTRHPHRTASIAAIAAILAFAIFFTGIITRDLKNGLSSLRARMGADLIVVPSDADTDLGDILLTGSPGYFYMDKEIAEKISGYHGAAQVTTQFYLTSTSASCCEIPVQFIGFDPSTDFVIRPWLEADYPKELGLFEVIVGNYVSVPSDGILTFYGRECKVVGKMSKTGTGLDSTVFANTETMKELMQASEEKGFVFLDETDPDRAISSVLIRTSDGVTPDQLRQTINKNLDGVRVITTQGMISQLSGSISTLSKVTYAFAALTIAVAIITLAALYSAIANERRREHGMLLILGYSHGMLLKSMILEILITEMIGAVIGLCLGLLFILPFQSAIAKQLSLPFLTASFPGILAISAVAVLITLAVGPLSSLRYIHGLTKIDAAELMKGN